MVGLAMAVAAVLAERRSSAGAAGVTAGVSADLVAGVGARNLGSGLPFNGEKGDLTLHPLERAIEPAWLDEVFEVHRPEPGSARFAVFDRGGA